MREFYLTSTTAFDYDSLHRGLRDWRGGKVEDNGSLFRLRGFRRPIHPLQGIVDLAIVGLKMVVLGLKGSQNLLDGDLSVLGVQVANDLGECGGVVVIHYSDILPDFCKMVPLYFSFFSNKASEPLPFFVIF